MSRPGPNRLPDPDRLRLAHETSVVWTRTADVDWPLSARVADQQWVLRLGDFPAEPLYALAVDGEEIGSFDTWPETWIRPIA